MASRIAVNPSGSFLKEKKQFEMPVKYICKSCQHIERQSISEVIAQTFIRIVLVFGVIFILLICMFGTDVFSVLLMQSSTINFAREYHVELRELALNLTNYSGSNAFTFADQLAAALLPMRYSYPSIFEPIQDPLETYRFGGDCKNSAVLFSAMMLNMGYKSEVSCNKKENHCVSKIYYNDMYMVVDLVGGYAQTYNKGDDFWSDTAIPLWHKNYRLAKIMAVLNNNLGSEVGIIRKITLED